MIIRTKYALLAPGEIRRDVRVEIDGGRIVAVDSGYKPGASHPDLDFGMAVLTPGLVNPHTHLELEFCSQRVPYSDSFLEWLQRIRDLKRLRGTAIPPAPRASLRGMAAAGCTTVLDHHTEVLDWEAIESCGLRYVAFREMFQFNNHAPDLDRMQASAHHSFAAHAPYTASVEIAEACRRLADARGLPMSMHLSEIEEEIAFIRDGNSSSIRKLLELAGATDPDWQGVGMSPVAYFAKHGVLDGSTYCVHVNYPEPGDMEILRQLKPTIVFCPKSHRFFKHPRHPIEQYLEAGIPVALGTDSLASNDSLSPLSEAGEIRREYPAVSAADLFAAITIRGLEPLGWDADLGRIEPGYLADLAVFALDGDPAASTPRTELFAAVLDAIIADDRSLLTLRAGQPIHALETARVA